MEYNSFYGGRRGASFVIATTFKTVNQMVAAFKQGGAYKTVNYDEYVLITTENLNDKENGRLYRRGMDYNNDMGGAIFEGQIVGPSGPAPHTLMTTIAEVDRITTEDGLVDDKGNTYRRTEGKYAPTINLLPGAKGTVANRTFDDDTDSIQWAAVSVRDANSYESTVHIGFKFPYPVIDFATQSVSTYSNGNYADTTKAERIDNEQHPFFEKWRISIPKGVKGDTLKNFRIITANDSIEDYTGKSDDVTNNRKVLVYDYYHYDSKENGEPKTLFLGDYNMISGISLAADGTITIDYTHDDDKVFTKAIKWVDQITLNTDTGVLTATYNHTTDAQGNPTTYTTTLDWVKDISISNDGTITFDYTDSADKVMNKLIKWVDQITLNGTTGHFKATYNHTTDASGNPTTYETDLRWVNNITLAADGTLTLKYTTGADVILNQKLKWVTNTEIVTGSTEGTGSQKLKVTYNDGTSAEIGNPLNYIMKTAIDNRYHLLIYHADPAKRTALVNKATWDGKNDWEDLGYIGNGTGVGAIAGYETDPGVVAVAETMPPYSAWLIIEPDSAGSI